MAELTLRDLDQVVAKSQDELGRQMAKELPGRIIALLKSADMTLADITGVIFFSGPGSFTGLRIGAATVNALSYGLTVPIVTENGDDWQQLGAERLLRGDNDKVALPFYGADAHITKPRK